MLDKEADFVTILSSDMIAQIVEEYFNKKVYKQQVEVVDTKPTEAGYMFSLAFVQVAQRRVIENPRVPKIVVGIDTPPKHTDMTFQEVQNVVVNPNSNKRNSKGQFVKDNV